MANFPADPIAFLPRGACSLTVEDSFASREPLFLFLTVFRVMRMTFHRMGVTLTLLTGSSSRVFKGKGIMSEQPTLQQFVNAATDEQVTEGRLITEDQGTAGQIVLAQGGNNGVEDETS
ncbi:hypothetical protein GUJ93_ZPchr0001g31469 [Zizania palustris]|uniref:Uncharacterized protein n=1 Tax=Zizania palustris TaxID=103762 RepID=A0A8J5RFZ3_ZIZPA|nr:hypothetical protein GUJ93_ZPchr0001g31469 [Zizania palustris]